MPTQAITGWDTINNPTTTEQRPTEQPASNLPVWGVIAGLLLPIVGVVIAIVLFTRGQIGPGLAVVLASFVGMVAALAFLAV